MSNQHFEFVLLPPKLFDIKWKLHLPGRYDLILNEFYFAIMNTHTGRGAENRRGIIISPIVTANSYKIGRYLDSYCEHGKNAIILLILQQDGISQGVPLMDLSFVFLWWMIIVKKLYERKKLFYGPMSWCAGKNKSCYLKELTYLLKFISHNT